MFKKMLLTVLLCCAAWTSSPVSATGVIDNDDFDASDFSDFDPVQLQTPSADASEQISDLGALFDHAAPAAPSPIAPWDLMDMRSNEMPGDVRRAKRGKKRGGGLTKSQKLFSQAAKACHRELRQGNLPTNKAMGDCMKSEMRDLGFKVGRKR